MIAIHAALYTFSPPKHSSEGGLYPHRRTIYVLWIAIPSLLASLAYLPPRGGYFTRGTYCALPIRPFWYRLALSWIPRYIILCAIVGIYISIYVHVRHKFNVVEMDLLETSPQRIAEQAGPAPGPRAGGLDGEDSRDPANRTALPKLRCHGLVTQSESGSGSFDWIPADLIPKPDTPRVGSASQIVGDTSDASDTCLVKEEASDHVDVDLGSRGDNLPTVRRSPSGSGVDGPADSQPVVGIMDALQESRISAQEAFQIAQRRSRDKLHRDRTPMTGTDRLRQSHLNIRRQLRMLFIYPLVYLMIWVLPFSWHCLQYSDYYVDHPPAVLVCLVTLVLALQCAINCTVFASREKVSNVRSLIPRSDCLTSTALQPWRFIPCSNGGFLGSFAIWQCTRSDSISHVEQHQSDEVSPGCLHTRRRNRRQRPRSHHPAGRTRAVVVQESRDARDRRTLEAAEATRMKALRDHLALGRDKVRAVPSSPSNDDEATGGRARVGRRGQEERFWWDFVPEEEGGGEAEGGERHHNDSPGSINSAANSGDSIINKPETRNRRRRMSKLWRYGFDWGVRRRDTGTTVTAASPGAAPPSTATTAVATVGTWPSITTGAGHLMDDDDDDDNDDNDNRAGHGASGSRQGTSERAPSKAANSSSRRSTGGDDDVGIGNAGERPPLHRS